MNMNIDIDNIITCDIITKLNVFVTDTIDHSTKRKLSHGLDCAIFFGVSTPILTPQLKVETIITIRKNKL